MNGLMDRMLLLLLLIWCSLELQTKGIVYMVLVGVAYGAFCYSMNRMRWIFSLILFLCMLFCDSFIPLLFLCIYETVISLLEKEFYLLYMGLGAATLYGIKIFLGQDTTIGALLLHQPLYLILWLGIGVLAAYLAWMSWYHDKNRQELIRIRDDNQEFRIMMNMRNELIRKNKDNEISMATLKERNRIAREIHDNVGHLLTRSIVQMGALRAIYQEEPLATGLRQVSETLDESMNNIRNSVHRLHNESFDLEKEVKECLKVQNRISSGLDYDMTMEAPKEIKYCFLAIVQEALNNVEKHSNATEVMLVMREHPAFYQLIIKDNGTGGTLRETGIGIHNMESRVKELGGTIHFSIDNGFRIFLMIPKKEVLT